MAPHSRLLIGCTLGLLASVASCTSSVAPRGAVAPAAPPTPSTIVDDDDEASPSPIAATLDDLLVVAIRRHTRRQPTATAELAYPIVIAYWELAYADAEADVRAAARETARAMESKPGDDVREQIAVLESSLLEAQANIERASRVLHAEVVATTKPALLRAADPLAITDDEIPSGAFAAERQRVARADQAIERAEHAMGASVRASAEMLQLQAAVTSARVARARALADLREAITTDELARGTLLAHHQIALR